MAATNSASKELALESIIASAIQIPGVKVDRNTFLSTIFANEPVDRQKIIELGPVAANCSSNMLSRIATKHVLRRTSESSAVSFAAGLPGGLAMAATIPADTLQFFAMALRLAQELSYLYGAEDLWQNGEIDSSMVQNQLIMYCGVMFGVSGASAGVRLLSSQIAKTTLKKLPQKALTKTIWYPIVKQIGKAVGIKVTKSTVAKGVSKALPIIGGVISGGMTFISMKPMGMRLADTLDKANFHYSEMEIMADYAVMQDMAQDSDFIESESAKNVASAKTEQTAQAGDVFIKIEKLLKLKDMGAISQEEFDAKKAELLEQI